MSGMVVLDTLCSLFFLTVAVKHRLEDGVGDRNQIRSTEKDQESLSFYGTHLASGQVRAIASPKGHGGLD